MKRRDFLLGTFGLGLLAQACKGNHIPVRFESQSPTAHKLRQQQHAAPSKFRSCELLVIGAGIAGLACMRKLSGSTKNIIWIESEQAIGGNSAWKQNSIGKYPLGAHYLPVPDERDAELLQFLTEAGCITAWKDGLPVYNEYHLCQDPEERLFYDGYWQEGLVPSFGIGPEDASEIKRFFEQVNHFKQKKGKDGKDWFCLPIRKCSNDEDARALDNLSFEADLRNRGFSSKALFMYLDYCCKDDYGCRPDQLSAWAGWHYFAARKGRSANASSGDVLTWPEGNGFLVNALLKQCTIQPETGVVALSISAENKSNKVLIWNSKTAEYELITCSQLVLATPQFVNKKLLPAHANAFRNWDYSPWMVANISLKRVPETKGMPLSWDNVWLGKKSLGYVNAGHQLLNPFESKTILSLYFPLCGDNSKEKRKQAHSYSESDWKKWIADELSYAHPGWEDYCSEIAIHLWGHAMPKPRPGFLTDEAFKQQELLAQHGIVLAHSDLSGLSLFEEAFHAGNEAAHHIQQIWNNG